MKLLLSFFLFTSAVYSQTWTAEELAAANTFETVTDLSAAEKETFQYLNLARMYPAKYAKIELVNEDKTSGNYKSLIKTLNTMAPVSALTFDKKAFESATCFAKEQSISGEIGHDRKNCKSYFYGECCSYGMSTGKNIIVQLLIDEGVESLGHRKICLSSGYSAVGIAFNKHKTYGFCCVLDFI